MPYCHAALFLMALLQCHCVTHPRSSCHHGPLQYTELSPPSRIEGDGESPWFWPHAELLPHSTHRRLRLWWAYPSCSLKDPRLWLSPLLWSGLASINLIKLNSICNVCWILGDNTSNLQFDFITCQLISSLPITVNLVWSRLPEAGVQERDCIACRLLSWIFHKKCMNSLWMTYKYKPGEHTSKLIV